MAAEATLDLTFGYADDTTRKVSFSPLADTAVPAATIKQRIKNFHTNDLANIAGLFLSDGGASCTGIVAATISKVLETEINLND